MCLDPFHFAAPQLNIEGEFGFEPEQSRSRRLQNKNILNRAQGSTRELQHPQAKNDEMTYHMSLFSNFKLV